MNVEEYLAATTKGDGLVDESGSPGDNDSLGSADAAADDEIVRWQGINSSNLYGDLSEQLGVTYLALHNPNEEENNNNIEMKGKIVNHRWVINLPLRREAPVPPGVQMDDACFSPFRNIIFVIDSGSPRSYLSMEAMQALCSSTSEEEEDNVSTATIPDVMDAELKTGHVVELFLSPSQSAEVNVLGSNVLKLADIATNVRNQEFLLTFLECWMGVK